MSDLDLPWLATASKKCRYLVAVSGGADSVALLHLLVMHGFGQLIVCHLDHGLRGRESTRDAAFVARLAQSLGLPCALGAVQVRDLAKERGSSLEVTARDERHRWFAQASVLHRAPRVILGHHADDQCETILFNLCRGSAGLKGMSVESRHRVGRRDLTFFRPLLHLRHAQLLDFLAERGLPHREDASNNLPFTPRNRLRHEAIPLLREICGRDVTPQILRAATLQDEQAQAIAALAAHSDALDPQGRLHLPSVTALPRAIQRQLLHEFLTRQGVAAADHALLDRALELLAGRGPAKLNLADGRFLRRRERRAFVE
jgi:tRNA(Ile)-lysidine synthase